MSDDRLFVDAKMKEAREDIPTKIALADVLASHRHPDDPNVTSPRDLLTHAARNVRAAGGGPATGPEVRGESGGSVWFTGGSNDQPYTLHWAGPLHSKWDWVALRYELHGEFHTLDEGKYEVDAVGADRPSA